MYYYISHLDRHLYSSDEYLSNDDLYCEQCGDSDEYLGYFETEEEAQVEYDNYYF